MHNSCSHKKPVKKMNVNSKIFPVMSTNITTILYMLEFDVLAVGLNLWKLGANVPDSELDVLDRQSKGQECCHINLHIRHHREFQRGHAQP